MTMAIIPLRNSKRRSNVTEAAPAAEDQGNVTATIPRLEELRFCASF